MWAASSEGGGFLRRGGKVLLLIKLGGRIFSSNVSVSGRKVGPGALTDQLRGGGGAEPEGVYTPFGKHY